MSHLTCSSVSIHDLDILKKTIAGFGGLHWNEGAKTFNSYGQTGQTKSEYGTCEHSIIVDGASYHIGVIKRKDGQGWVLAADFSADPGLWDAVGYEASKLMAAYGETVFRQEMELKGFMVEEGVDEDGNVMLTATSPN